MIYHERVTDYENPLCTAMMQFEYSWYAGMHFQFELSKALIHQEKNLPTSLSCFKSYIDGFRLLYRNPDSDHKDGV